MLPTLLRTLAAAASALLPALVAAAGSVTYFHNDLAGSPVAATDASGQVLWRESYRPYGERLVNAPAASADTVWFTSRRQDPETGLVYMGARFYDPLAGRFVSPDPVGFDEANLHSFNRYAYANNNPYKYVDPDGASPVLLLRLFGGGAIGGAVGAAADAASQYAAFGSVDWAMAARSTAAQEAAAAGALGFLPAGTPAGLGIKPVAEGVAKGAGTAAKGSSEAIQVTKSGVALPPGAKHQIPDSYVQNPHRSGSYGEVVDGKFKERLRIDPPTPSGQKGPDYSHYHLDGKGTHYSPRPGNKDPGFAP